MNDNVAIFRSWSKIYLRVTLRQMVGKIQSFSSQSLYLSHYSIDFLDHLQMIMGYNSHVVIYVVNQNRLILNHRVMNRVIRVKEYPDHWFIFTHSKSHHEHKEIQRNQGETYTQLQRSTNTCNSFIHSFIHSFILAGGHPVHFLFSLGTVH